MTLADKRANEVQQHRFKRDLGVGYDLRRGAAMIAARIRRVQRSAA